MNQTDLIFQIETLHSQLHTKKINYESAMQNNTQHDALDELIQEISILETDLEDCLSQLEKSQSSL